MTALLRRLREALYLRGIPRVTEALAQEMTRSGDRIRHREQDALVRRVMREIHRRNRR